MRRFIWVLPAVLLLAACAGAGTSATSSGRSALGGTAASAVSEADPAVAAPAPAQGEAGTNGVPVPQAFDPTRAVILTANIAMKATDPWALSDKAQAVAADARSEDGRKVLSA